MAYRDPKVQLTYGQFRMSGAGTVGWARDYPAEVKAARSYRGYDWIATHLRTFRYGLWRRLQRHHLNDPQTGAPHTAHTTNPVPIWWVHAGRAGRRLRDGGLADIAPTVLDLMGLPAPAEMTGRSLLSE